MPICYPYCDRDGTLIYSVERTPPKSFAILRPNGQRLPDPVPEHLAVLYRLPDLLAADPAETVFVCEGEKDVETLIAHGLVATTMPCGTRMGWLPKYNAPLEGRHVAILPDADGPGRRHAEAVHQQLETVAATVVIVDLHNRESGPWDASDWFGRTGTIETLWKRVRTARYAAIGMPERSQGGVIKPRKMWLLLHSGLTSRAKLLLIAIQECLEWSFEPQPLPTAASLAELVSSHRVSVQNQLTSLRRRGIITPDRREHAVHWDILAAMCSRQGHQYRAPEPPEPVPVGSGRRGGPRRRRAAASGRRSAS